MAAFSHDEQIPAARGKEGPAAVADPVESLSIPAQALDVLIDSLDQIAEVLPEGQGLLTAVYDPEGLASDVLVREPGGHVSLLLGLQEKQQRRLRHLVSLVLEGLDPTASRESRMSTLSPPDPYLLSPGLLQQHSYRTILEQSPVPTLVVTPDGLIGYASPAAVPVLRLQHPAQLTGTPFGQLLHADDRERVARISGPMGADEGTVLMVRLRRSDDTYARVKMDVRTLHESGSLLITLQDTTAKPMRLEELLLAERRQRALSSAADCGTALLGADTQSLGVIIEANPVLGRILRSTGVQVTGHPLWELVHESDAHRVREALHSVAQDGRLRRLEVRLSTDPSRRAELTISVDYDSGDPPTQLTARVRDVTEQRSFVRELSRTVSRLEQVNGDLAEFAKITAHDLMAPLRALAGLVDLLTPSLDEESLKTMEAIRIAISRMLAMVEGALAFASAHTDELQLAPVDLGEVLRSVLTVLETEIEASEATVTVGELPIVNGDASQLERLFLCLLNNALSYAASTPAAIHIDAEREGTMWQVSVADNGIGIDPESRERIFGLFERRATGSPGKGGTGRGIGLATCRRVVESHQGRIWVEPNTPAGSVFKFTLPAAQ